MIQNPTVASVTCFGLTSCVTGAGTSGGSSSSSGRVPTPSSSSGSSSSGSINNNTSVANFGMAALSSLSGGAPLSTLSLTYQGIFDLQSSEGE